MIRQLFAQTPPGKQKGKIKWRTHEVARIEALSDGVFAFAISLLVISLDVPKTSKELIDTLWGLIPFCGSFTIIFWIWRSQYKFFRRYGLHDTTTIALNGVLLFFILAFVYPLKFLISCIVGLRGYSIAPGDFLYIWILYSIGLAMIRVLFSLMYLNAYNKRKEIKLSEIEIFETVSYIWMFILPVFPIVIVSVILICQNSKDNENILHDISWLALLPIEILVFRKIRKRQYFSKFGGKAETEPLHNPEDSGEL